MAKIGLVTVLYKSDNVLDGFFKSISIQTYKDYVLYLIDNSSSDATDALIQRLAQTCPVSRYYHIKSPGNIGVAAGNNAGIKKAIDDHQITSAEYEEIMAIADEDGVIDPQERQLLALLHDMIADKSVKRVP